VLVTREVTPPPPRGARDARVSVPRARPLLPLLPSSQQGRRARAAAHHHRRVMCLRAAKQEHKTSPATVTENGGEARNGTKAGARSRRWGWWWWWVSPTSHMRIDPPAQRAHPGRIGGWGARPPARGHLVFLSAPFRFL
jgi:hypothetical protein